MTRAYNECYLSDAKESLSECFSYLIDGCRYEPETAAAFFEISGYAKRFERGNPGVLAGMSGIEMAREIVRKTNPSAELPKAAFDQEGVGGGLSAAWWAGWALAEYQWYSGRTFADIFEHIPLRRILELYGAYHEMDISRFLEAMEELCSAPLAFTRLKLLRESRGLSQAELARESGVGLRSIQMYEQRENDIDKAQAHTIYKLSRVIGCEMEDLLENPMR